MIIAIIDPVVERRLGRATARLHCDLVAVVCAGGDPRTVEDIRPIIRELLCGAFHDYRSEAPNAKRDLLMALKAVRATDRAAAWTWEIERNIQRGWYDEDHEEMKRWVERIKPPDRPPPEVAPPRKRITGRFQKRLIAFITEFFSDHGKGPTYDEIVAALHANRPNTVTSIKRLARKGWLMKIGNARGWIPR